MFSKVLVKLIDQAILPAALLVAVRIASIIFIATFYSYQYYIDANGFHFYSPNAYTIVNSMSIFLMVVALFFGMLFVIVKSYFFHSSHIKPSTTAKLFSLSLDSIIKDSLDLYSETAVWISYIYLITLVSGIMSVSGLVYSWVFIVSLILAINSTVLMILDIEKEVRFEKDAAPEYDDDDKFVEESK